MLFGIAFQGGKMILEQKLGIIQQPADQRGLAVIHRTAGQKAQEGLLLLRGQVFAKTGGRVHQKYPSFFFFSIEAFSSLSIRRP